MLEDDFKKKKQAMEEATKNYNKIMAQAKNDSIKKDQDNRIASERADLQQTLQRGQKQGWPNTGELDTLDEERRNFMQSCNKVQMGNVAQDRQNHFETQYRLGQLDHNMVMDNYKNS